MKSATTAVGALILTVAMLVTATAARAATTCEILGTGADRGLNKYRCTGTQLNPDSSVKSVTSYCITFTVPAVLTAGPIDMVAEGLPADAPYFCACKASGSASNPKFESSREFVCANDRFLATFSGKVNGSGLKIKPALNFFQGTVNGIPGPVMQALECVTDSTCP